MEDRLDIEAMREAASVLIGEHDFSAFCGSNGDQEDFTRTIFDCQVEREGDLVTFSVTGDGFLYNMVRILTGTLIEVGRGLHKPEEMQEIISAMDRSVAGFTAPAQGLYLLEVEY